ncbi:Enzyme that catalyzes the fourth step in the histidine pathway [Mortierella sp. AM989]|nr:Enzyme that catalyzes the fourth step in the histidine pathway [Mortierella sp. AM989]
MSSHHCTAFRPCIDLHSGQVKQIVGGSLNDKDESLLKTNFVSNEPPSYYAKLYRDNNLTGAHVIKLGPGNDDAAKECLRTWPDGLQIGGGITLDNAQTWIDAGAAKVIVTSYLFPGAKFSLERLQGLCKAVGKNRLVVDVSCRKRGSEWIVAMDKWQTMTDMKVNKESMDLLAQYCSEFLVHAADVEGLCKGIDEDLVQALGEWTSIPTTYAGGANALHDLELVNRLSNGKVDLTFGSALDIFGGKTVKFDDCVAWNNAVVHIKADGA